MSRASTFIQEHQSKKFVKPRRAKGDSLVWVDVPKFDIAWSKDVDYYIGIGGTTNAIGGRYERFKEYYNSHDSIEVPEVYVDQDGIVSFTNGRHRFAYMRDIGLKRIPVAMSRESVNNAKKHSLLHSNQSEG